MRPFLMTAVAIVGTMAPSASLPWQSSHLETQSRGQIVDAAGEQTARWPQFRGPNASGVSDERRLPVEFSATKNVIWKTLVPSGNSSPCVWGDTIFLTAFTESKQLLVLCVDGSDGRIRWQKEVPAKRIEKVYDYVYVVKGGGIVSCFEAATGKRIWRQRIAGSGNYSASPIAGGKLYIRAANTLYCFGSDSTSRLLTGRP